MREFNTFGPVYPDRHYYVNRITIKANLRARIDKGRYLTLNAGRQTGKTTLFREVIAELEATGDYFGIIVETKIWYDKAKYEQGKKQLVRYLQAAGLHKGYMVIFDEQLDQNPLLTDQSETFKITVDEKVLRIYLVGVEV